MPLLRSTLHLVTTRDAFALQPVLAPVLERDFWASQYGPRLRGIDVPALVTAAREIIQELPRTNAELGRLLALRCPDVPPAVLVYAARALIPVAQPPPRGVWGKSGAPRLASLGTFLKASLDEAPASDPSPDPLLLRYLRAYGPASVRDVQAWSGLSGVGEVIDRLRPRLRTFADESGRELVDVRGAPLPDPDVPAPPRFLPTYDNALLAHADRTHIVGEAHRKQLLTRNGVGPGTVLIDGFVGATWTIEGTAASAALCVTPLQPIPAATRAAVEDEATSVLELAAPAMHHDVAWC